MFEVKLSHRAEREFAKLSQKLQQKFFNAFKNLSTQTVTHPHVKKIKGTKFGYRLRIWPLASVICFFVHREED